MYLVVIYSKTEGRSQSTTYTEPQLRIKSFMQWMLEWAICTKLKLERCQRVNGLYSVFKSLLQEHESLNTGGAPPSFHYYMRQQGQSINIFMLVSISLPFVCDFLVWSYFEGTSQPVYRVNKYHMELNSDFLISLNLFLALQTSSPEFVMHRLCPQINPSTEHIYNIKIELRKESARYTRSN